MSDPSRNQNEASSSRSSTPTPPSSHQLASAPSTSQQDIARLENDLIPSPPASDSGRPQSDNTSPSNTTSYTNVDGSARVYRFPNDLPPRFGGSGSEPVPNERVVTVRDLRTKSCWICSEEDEDLPAPAASASPSSTPASRPRRFVHPCNCTLVAHESCLLRWIDQSKRNHPLQDHVTCPQCKAPYVLINNKTALLRVFEFFDRLVTRVEPIGAVTLLGGSILVACTTYGCVAIRMLLGKDAARRALASPWPWHYWVDIPLIPFALVASRLDIFDSAMIWAPTLVAFHINSIPMVTATAAHGRLFDRYLQSGIFNARAYPPGPALTALLVPWIRVFYLALKRRVYHSVLSPFYGSRRSNASSRTNEGRRNRRRVVIVGEPETFLVDGDAALGNQPMPDGTGGPMLQLRATVDGRGEPQDAEGEDGEPVQTVYVTHHSLARFCLGALSLPFVANLMGRILARLARFSPLLARFLGMKNVPSTSILSSFYTTKSHPTPTSKSSTTPSPIASLFRGNLPYFDAQTQDNGKAEDKKPFSERLTLLGHSPRYDDLDPVWFRNAVGAGIYILLKDAGSLLYRYLRLTQRNKTEIKDLPFQAGLVFGLDLRE